MNFGSLGIDVPQYPRLPVAGRSTHRPKLQVERQALAWSSPRPRIACVNQCLRKALPRQTI